MGVLFAGVFWGVLHHEINWLGLQPFMPKTYGAVGRSNFLLRIGSDILCISEEMFSRVSTGAGQVPGMEGSNAAKVELKKGKFNQRRAQRDR